MQKIKIIPATLSHVQEIARTMNAEDRLEIESIGLKAHRVLWRSWNSSIIRKTGLLDGEVAACWGCAGSLMGIVGTPWFITAKKAREVDPVIFAKLYRREVREMLKIFAVLENYVDSSYIGAVKMLKLTGFHLDEPIEVGKMKRLYQRYWKTA